MSKINPSVKEAVETIYELTKDGYTGDLSTLGWTVSTIARLLKTNGALQVTENLGAKPTYHWNEQAMAPTTVFIKNIDEAFKKYQSERKARTREKARVTADVTSSKRGLHAVFRQQADDMPSTEDKDGFTGTDWPDGEKNPEPHPYASDASAPDTDKTEGTRIPGPIISRASEPFNPEELPESALIPLLTTFTDEQLWKELLRRGWTIRDNKLTKTLVMHA